MRGSAEREDGSAFRELLAMLVAGTRVGETLPAPLTPFFGLLEGEGPGSESGSGESCPSSTFERAFEIVRDIVGVFVMLFGVPALFVSFFAVDPSS